MSAQLDQELNNLFVCLSGAFGDEIGSAVTEKINAVLQIEGVDVAALQAQINTLNDLLSNNTSGDASTAAAITAAIAGLTTRVTALEGSTAVADLTAVVTALQTALTNEAAERQAADAAHSADIATVQQAVDSLSQSLVTIQATLGQQGAGCDCVAINDSLASIGTQLSNLTSTDTAQASQIADLQTAVAALTSQAAGIAAAQAAADAAAAQAAAAVAAATAAGQTAAAAGQAAATAQASADAAAAAGVVNAADIEAVKAAIRGVNCVSITANFRTHMRQALGLTTSLGGGNN